MHYVAVVEESVPAMAVNLFLVESHDVADGRLDYGVASVAYCGQAPDAEGSFAMEIVWCGQQGQSLSESRGTRCVCCASGDEKGRSASYAAGCAETRLHIFVGCIERVRNGVVVGKRVGFSFRRVETDGYGGCVSSCSLYEEGRRVALPEVG